MAKQMSKDEAVAWVKKEMGFTKEMSETIVANVDQNDDRHIDEDELETLKAITTETKDRLKGRFDEYDHDGSGFVSKSDAKLILSSELKGLPDSTVNNMVNRFDKDENDKVDIKEFIMFFSYARAKKDSVEKRFAELDLDGDKQLSMDELVTVLQETLMIDSMTAFGMLRDMGVDDDEGTKMNLDEFKSQWTKLCV